MHHAILRTLMATCFCVVVSAASAADWSMCENALRSLDMAASMAASAASEADWSESALEKCRALPATFDLMRDNCRSAASTHKTDVDAVQRQLHALRFNTNSVRASCGVDIEGPSASTSERVSASPYERQCNLFRSYRGRLPDAGINKVCAEFMSESDCKKCLSGN